jgi:hypothetical protein
MEVSYSGEQINEPIHVHSPIIDGGKYPNLLAVLSNFAE